MPGATVTTERAVRYRVNVSTSVRGVKTYDATIEVEGDAEWATQEHVLKRLDALTSALDTKYPPPAPAEEKPKKGEA